MEKCIDPHSIIDTVKRIDFKYINHLRNVYNLHGKLKLDGKIWKKISVNNYLLPE